VLLETKGRSTLERVVITGAGRMVFQQAPARFERCVFSTTADGDHITMVRCAVVMKECVIAGGTDGLVLVAAQVKATDCEVRGAKDDGLALRGGELNWTNGSIGAGKGAGVKLGVQGQATLEGAAVRSAADGVEVREGSALIMTRCAVVAQGIGVRVKDQERKSGASRVQLDNVRIKADSAEVEAGEGNAVRRDGIEVLPGETSKAE
jgi:hypothetical protein